MRCTTCKQKLTTLAGECAGCHSKVPLSSRFLLFLFRTDEILAGLCLTIMILAVLLQIVLRNIFQTGIGGTDPLVRHLVLWVVFLGAGLAAKENSHIRIDFISRLVSPAINKIIETIVSLFSLIILGMMIYAAVSFIGMEYESGFDIPLLNIPVWVTEVIIPVGYFIVAVHMLRHALKPFFSRKEE